MNKKDIQLDDYLKRLAEDFVDIISMINLHSRALETGILTDMETAYAESICISLSNITPSLKNLAHSLGERVENGPQKFIKSIKEKENE